MTRTLGMALAAVLFAAAGVAKADVMANYEFTSGSLASTDTHLTSTATDVTDGGGFGATGTSNPFNGITTPKLNSNAFDILFADSTNSEESNAGALAGGDYIEFTVTPDVGLVLDLESFMFDFRSVNMATGNHAAWALYSDVDSYATPIDSNSGNRAAVVASDITVDLSATTYDALSSVTFRLVVWSNFNLTFRGVGFDDVRLNGVTVVPEPASMALLGLGGLMMLRRRGVD